MERLALVAVVTLVVVVAALALRRLRPRGGPVVPGPEGWRLVSHVERADFPDPGAAWLVAVFTSATCATCAEVWAKAQVLAAPDVAVTEVEYGARRDLHDRYRIGAVPAVAVVDAEGAVRRWVLGPTTAADLWAAVAEARDQAAPGDGAADPGTAGQGSAGQGGAGQGAAGPPAGADPAGPPGPPPPA